MTNQLPKGYLGVQRLNGYSHTIKQAELRTLVYTIDMWIEENTDLIKEIRVSKDFYNRLAQAVGYEVKTLDTIIGAVPFTIAKYLFKDQIEIIKSVASTTLSPKATPDFSQTSYNRDEVKNTCEKITCPVIEEAKRREIDAINDQIMKSPLREAHDRIAELEDALTIIANHKKPPQHHSFYEDTARAVLKRGAQ